MTLKALAIGAALVAAAPAFAQSAKENFSYQTPSGMFGDGTFKWNMYRFMHEDRERTSALGDAAQFTGSIENQPRSGSVARTGARGR